MLAHRRTIRTPEKKKPEESVIQAPEPQKTAPEPSRRIEFRQENAEQILTEVISQTGFTLSSALKSLTSIAISGPNGLELRLGSTYDFQKRVIEQSENRNSLQSIVANLTGVDPLISLKIIAESARQAPQVTEAPKPTTSQEHKKESPPQIKGPSPLNVRNDIDPEQDAFVQHVVDLFGAKVVRITDAPARREAVAETDEDD